AIADLQRCAAADRRGRDAWLVVAGEDQRPGNNLELPSIGVVPPQRQRARPNLVELGARRTAGDRASQRRVVAVGVADGIAGTNRHVAVRGEVGKKLWLAAPSYVDYAGGRAEVGVAADPKLSAADRRVALIVVGSHQRQRTTAAFCEAAGAGDRASQRQCPGGRVERAATGTKCHAAARGEGRSRLQGAPIQGERPE